MNDTTGSQAMEKELAHVSSGDPNDVSRLSHYARLLVRHKWFVALVLAGAGIASILMSLRQAPLYEASAEVYLTRQNLSAALTGTPDPAIYDDANRIAQTEAQLARSPELVRRVLRTARSTDTSPTELLEQSAVNPTRNADLLEFVVRASDADMAVLLANRYASEFTQFRKELNSRSIQRALGEVNARLARLGGDGGPDAGLRNRLSDTRDELRTILAIQSPSSEVIRTAETANRVQPTPVKNLVLALFAGMALIVLVLVLRESLQRTRSTSEVASMLRLPVLASINLRRLTAGAEAPLPMMFEPASVDAEAFRSLRTNIELTSLRDRTPMTSILVTSAFEDEGKSTVAANLAIAFARSGKSVALIDMDLRRPSLAALFGVPRGHGVADVAAERISLESALSPVSLSVGARGGGMASRWLPQQQARKVVREANYVRGSLDLLQAGGKTPDPGELVSSDAVAEILTKLESRYDLLIVDSPPLLHVGDAAILSTRVGGLVLVTRLQTASAVVVSELQSILESCPAAKLGIVLTGQAVLKVRSYRDSFEGVGSTQEALADVHGLEQARSGYGL